MTVLVLYVATALCASFACSLLEAALLSSRMVELSRRHEEGDEAAGLLLHLKQERIDDAISSILVLNTVANTVGSTLAGAQAAKLWGQPWVGVFTFGMVLGVLFLSEIIPKTLGTVYWPQMVGFVAHATLLLTRVLKPILYVTRLLTGFVGKQQEPISRGELAAMIAMATREGTLALSDSRVVHNVLRVHDIRVEDVMTPRTVITMLPSQATIADLLDDEHCRVFSRLPLYDETPDDVVGFVLQREVLSAAARGHDPTTPLLRFLRKAPYLPEALSVGRAMQQLIDSREHLALVTDEYGGLAGLVTLEDLVETLLGVEIVDESDRVPDLRAEASRLRRRRLDTLERWRDEVAAEKRRAAGEPGA